LFDINPQVQFLEQMGCEFAGFFLTPLGEVCHNYGISQWTKLFEHEL